MRYRLLGLLPLGALALTGCGTPGPPEVTFFADGHAIDAEPLIHCDVTVRKCEQSKDGAPKLKVRPGKPVQISVPSDVTETPWLVNVQYANAKGELQPIKQQVFTSGKQYAYTATTPAPDDQLLVVEIQQVGVATSVDATGKPNADAEGNPQLVARAVWSLQVQPG